MVSIHSDASRGQRKKKKKKKKGGGEKREKKKVADDRFVTGGINREAALHINSVRPRQTDLSVKKGGEKGRGKEMQVLTLEPRPAQPVAALGLNPEHPGVALAKEKKKKKGEKGGRERLPRALTDPTSNCGLSPSRRCPKRGKKKKPVAAIIVAGPVRNVPCLSSRPAAAPRGEKRKRRRESLGE